MNSWRTWIWARSDHTLDPRSFVIATYALCGFANLSSVAIQVGGIGALAPVAQIRSGAAGVESRGLRNHGQLHVRLHRGDDVMSGLRRQSISAGSEWCLGSGLGAFADTLDCRTETPYAEIAGWPVSTAIGHAGKLVTGRIGGTEVIVLAGRAHLYEGYTAAAGHLRNSRAGAPRSARAWC